MNTPEHRRLLMAVLAIVVPVISGCGTTIIGHHVKPARPVPSHVLMVSATPQRTIPLRALQQAAIPAPQASWLAYYDGAIWVKRDDGFVIRVDPRTDRRTGAAGLFTGQDTYCQGIGAGGGAVWSCQHHAITRIDPRTAKIVAKLPIAKVFDQGRYVFAHGRIWLITGVDGNELTGLDPATDTAGPPILLPYGCSDLAPGGSAVWVLCPLNGHVVEVDVTRRRVVGAAAVLAAYNGYATPTDLWVGTNSDLVRIDATTLKPTVTFRNIGPGQEGDVTVVGNRVWVSTNNGPLYSIDATTNTVLDRIQTPAGVGGGALIAAADSLWTTPSSSGPVLRLRIPK